MPTDGTHILVAVVVTHHTKRNTLNPLTHCFAISFWALHFNYLACKHWFDMKDAALIKEMTNRMFSPTCSYDVAHGRLTNT